MPMIDTQYSDIVKYHERQNKPYFVVSRNPKKAPKGEYPLPMMLDRRLLDSNTLNAKKQSHA